MLEPTSQTCYRIIVLRNTCVFRSAWELIISSQCYNVCRENNLHSWRCAYEEEVEEGGVSHFQISVNYKCTNHSNIRKFQTEVKILLLQFYVLMNKWCHKRGMPWNIWLFNRAVKRQGQKSQWKHTSETITHPWNRKGNNNMNFKVGWTQVQPLSPVFPRNRNCLIHSQCCLIVSITTRQHPQ